MCYDLRMEINPQGPFTIDIPAGEELIPVMDDGTFNYAAPMIVCDGAEAVPIVDQVNITPDVVGFIVKFDDGEEYLVVDTLEA